MRGYCGTIAHMELALVYPELSVASRPLPLTTVAEQYREPAYAAVTADARAAAGQFFTPPPVARLMASFFETLPADIHLLDAGAGVGILTAAFVDELLAREQRPRRVQVIAYEQEPKFLPYLRQTMAKCRAACEQVGIIFTSVIRVEDFVDAASTILRPCLLEGHSLQFNCVILNPPYKKIHSDSHYRRRLRDAGVETVNLYTAFIALAAALLEPEGQLVAITPRSFCNGPYYKSFRRLFNEQMAFRHIHLFESRDETFAGDEVLQENIIFHAVKTADRRDVAISSSQNPQETAQVCRTVAYKRVINAYDPHLFIHITTSDCDQLVADRMERFSCTLTDLGLEVSTGRVVDFRSEPFLRQQPETGTVPLIYPHHMQAGFIHWPDKDHRKPNAFVEHPESRKWLLPPGYYVVVRRFSSKEEAKRVNAAVYAPERVTNTSVAFENHVNVFHAWNKGMTLQLAHGLALYLNSTLLDTYFRQFNGHTQVNATDLRSLPYPHQETLERWGQSYRYDFPDQQTIDALIETELQAMSNIHTPDPIVARKRVAEALTVLQALGLPRGQQNERSAMTLLALLNLSPEKPWSAADMPLLGITPIMNFIREQYGVEYAPNTRETIRRQTMHQFVQAALVVENPDDPTRPVNSPYWCYQIEPVVLNLLRQYGSDNWEGRLTEYQATSVTLQERYARQRELHLVPVQVSLQQEINLSAGKHSLLIKQIIEQFAPRFAPGSTLVYVGDTSDKWGYFDNELLASLGIVVGLHGKMPDVVLYEPVREWLLLIEAVTSHGPVNPKRRFELEELFVPMKDKIVYITAFHTRSEMARHLVDISWETEVWVADDPTHLIHFDGVRFLGPYGSEA